jgi:glycolate oxidase
MSVYGRVTKQVVEELKAIAGSENVFTRKDDLESYSRDEMPLVKPRAPEVVVKPADSDTIARLLRFASERRIPVTPRGAGTGLSGGSMPIHGGILLSLERMNRILKVDKENFVAVVEPGVTLEELYGEVEKEGLYYPIYLGEKTASIGGNVATNAGGMNAIRYGVTRHNILGLEAVLPTGEVIDTGGEFVKCSSGYDLTQLIIGSEGTLAVVTRIILRLTTKPAIREVLFAPFESLQDAVDAIPGILGLKTTPTGIEFMERGIVEVVEKHLNREVPYHQYEAFLMVIMDGESEDEIHNYFIQVEAICKQHGAVEAMVPGSERAKRRLFEVREDFYHALSSYAPMEIIDVVVPRSQIARFARKVKEISAEHGVPVIFYGHAGDGNVHLHPVCLDMEKDEWQAKLPVIMKDIYQAGVSFGGAISGEHGIGFAKKAYLPLQMDGALLNVMRGIKRAFDPSNILNPGKIFDL